MYYAPYLCLHSNIQLVLGDLMPARQVVGHKRKTVANLSEIIEPPNTNVPKLNDGAKDVKTLDVVLTPSVPSVPTIVHNDVKDKKDLNVDADKDSDESDDDESDDEGVIEFPPDFNDDNDEDDEVPDNIFTDDDEDPRDTMCAKSNVGNETQTQLEKNLLAALVPPNAAALVAVNQHFQPKTFGDLCTCTHQTIMSGHYGECGRSSTKSSNYRHDQFNKADVAYKRLKSKTTGERDMFYTYTKLNGFAPLKSNPKEVVARLNFIESLVYHSNIEIILVQLNQVLNGVTPLSSVVAQYISDTEACAEAWFQTLPITGARLVGNYAFQHERKLNTAPVWHGYKFFAKTFRRRTIVQLKEEVHFVKVMQKCLPINFDALRIGYMCAVATPPCHPNKEFDALKAKFETIKNDDNWANCSYSDFSQVEQQKVQNCRDMRNQLWNLYCGLDRYDDDGYELVSEVNKWQMIQQQKPEIYLERMKSIQRFGVLDALQDKLLLQAIEVAKAEAKAKAKTKTKTKTKTTKVGDADAVSAPLCPADLIRNNN